VQQLEYKHLADQEELLKNLLLLSALYAAMMFEAWRCKDDTVVHRTTTVTSVHVWSCVLKFGHMGCVQSPNPFHYVVQSIPSDCG
jgi:hypothetical protein